MKKENYLIFTSLLGLMPLYGYLFTKTLAPEKKALRKELVFKVAGLTMGGIMIPAGIISLFTGSLSQNQELLRNMIHLLLLLWIYIVGAFTVKSLLKWKRERLDQWNDLKNFPIRNLK